MPINRREFLKTAIGAVFLYAMRHMFKSGDVMAEEKIMKISLTEEEWKKRLNAQQYDILREEGTERAFTSPLNDEKREGVFVCAGCDFELFPSKYKFDSGTGWPSFYDVVPGHVETKTDYKIGVPRTEYHCAKCGGHHGHLFNDGPAPTGLRYCSNGAVLKFIPKKA